MIRDDIYMQACAAAGWSFADTASLIELRHDVVGDANDPSVTSGCAPTMPSARGPAEPATMPILVRAA